eukprot:scaffold24064_cov323-Cylindrotheca_fusiformis.AAC.1
MDGKCKRLGISGSWGLVEYMRLRFESWLAWVADVRAEASSVVLIHFAYLVASCEGGRAFIRVISGKNLKPVAVLMLTGIIEII